jgi:hypothetical protein
LAASSTVMVVANPAAVAMDAGGHENHSSILRFN